MTLPIILRVLLILFFGVCFLYSGLTTKIKPSKSLFPVKAALLLVFGLGLFFSVIELEEYRKPKPTELIYNQMVNYKVINNKYVPIDTIYKTVK